MCNFKDVVDWAKDNNYFWTNISDKVGLSKTYYVENVGDVYLSILYVKKTRSVSYNISIPQIFTNDADILEQLFIPLNRVKSDAKALEKYLGER